MSFGVMSGFLFVHASLNRHVMAHKSSRDWLRDLVTPAVPLLNIAFVFNVVQKIPIAEHKDKLGMTFFRYMPE
jgi:hypothetical protein